MLSAPEGLSAIPLPEGVTLTLAPEFDPTFGDALFYPPKVVLATLDGPGGQVVVVRSGTARVRDHRLSRTVVSAGAFRNAYPDGAVPEDDDRMEWDVCTAGFFPTRAEKVGSYPEFFDRPTMQGAVVAAAKIAATPGYTKEDALAELVAAARAKFGSTF